MTKNAHPPEKNGYDSKVRISSRTNAKTYSEEFSSREGFCRAVGPKIGSHSLGLRMA